MQDYASRQRQPQRHALGMALVVLLHLLLFWAIQSGLSRTVIQKAQGVVDVLLLTPDKPRPPEVAPAPPRPAQPAPPKPQLPVLPSPPVAVTPAANAVTVAPSTSPSTPSPTPVAPAAPAARSEPVRTAAVVNAAQCEKPEYPSASRRMEEEGTVHLRFLVGVDGKVIQSEVEKSSGYKRLDEAARAGLAKCQFRPAAVDGKPEQAWASMRYTWRLE